MITGRIHGSMYEAHAVLRNGKLVKFKTAYVGEINRFVEEIRLFDGGRIIYWKYE